MKDLHIIIKILILSLMLFVSKETKSNHIIAGNLTYECVGANTYEVSLTFYSDCNGPTPPNSVTIDWVSINCGLSNSVVADLIIGYPVEVTPICSSTPSACGGGGTVGVLQYRYTATIILPGACSDYVFSWNICCRNAVITNLSTPTTENFHISTLLDNTLFPCNNSPTFVNVPMTYVCQGDVVNFNNGAVDTDGDSLVYSLVNCKRAQGTSVTYTGGFSGTNPLSVPISINSSNGQLTFTPTAIEVGVICVLVEEYRGGIKTGEVMRDIQVSVTSCTNNSPVITGIDGATGSGAIDYETTICAGVPFCFDVFSNDADLGNTLSMFGDNSIIGSSFNVTAGPLGGNQLKGTFCWTPTVATVGTYFYTVRVSDDACPIVGTTIHSYTIHVRPNPEPPVNAGPNTEICVGGAIGLSATTVSSNAVSYEWSPTVGLSNPNIPNPIASPTSTTTYSVTLTYNNGCTSTDDVRVNVNKNPNISLVPNNINVCGGSNTTVMGFGDTPGLTYEWTDLNTLATGFPLFAANSPGTLNGTTESQLTFNMYMASGSYNFQLKVTNPTTNCSVTKILTLMVGAAPVIPICANIYVTPTGLGTNSGTINSPTTLQNAVLLAACNTTVIKMATGNYTIPNALNISDFLTIEGGFDPTDNWSKTSQAGATTITRANVNSVGIPNLNERIIAIQAINKQRFRLQDLTIRTDNASNGSAISTYGVYLNNVSNYNITRVQVQTGNAGSGSNGIVGCGRSSTAPLGLDPMDGVVGENGKFTLLATSYPGGRGGDGGQECGSFIFALNGEGGNDLNGGNGAAGSNATPGMIHGGGGGGGGRGGNGSSAGGNGGAGGRGGVPFTPPASCSGNATGLGAFVPGGLGGTLGPIIGGSGGIGNNGIVGIAGCSGATGTLGTHTPTIYQIGSVGDNGESGGSGGGGSGGGGGGGAIIGPILGNSAGGGGGGGSGGLGGAGGFAGGGSFGVYIVNNGSNGFVEHSNVQAGAPGLGGIGGLGGLAGLGNNGGTAPSLLGLAAGGKGGNGGKGGDGGKGGNGRTGQAQNIFWNGVGVAPVALDSTFNFSNQANVKVEGSNCTNRTVRFTDASLPIASNNTNWIFDLLGSNASPLNDVNNPSLTQYTGVGRFDIGHPNPPFGAPYDEYRGFYNVSSAPLANPDILSSANVIGVDTFQLCEGDFANFSSSVVGDTFYWNFNGAILPNPGNVQVVSGAQFNIAGFFPVELYISNICCGPTLIDTVWLFVDPLHSAVPPPANQSICQGSSTTITLSSVFGTDSIVWSPSGSITKISNDTYTAFPSATTNYTIDIYSQVVDGGLTRYSCPITINTTIQVQPALTTNISATPILCGGDFSTITVGASGGGGPLTYTWSGGNSGTFPTNVDVISGAIGGTYNVTVSDGMGCDEVTSVVISEPSPVVGQIFGFLNVLCHGDSTGRIVALGAGGAGFPYTYQWDAAAGNQTTAVATGLKASINYCVTISDINSCFDVVCHTLTEPPLLSLSIINVVQVACFGDSTGQAEAGITGGTGVGSYTYNWSDGQTTVVATGLQVANSPYSVTVTDGNSCSTTDVVNITQNPPVLAPDLNALDTVVCIGDSVSFFTTAAGPTFNWSGPNGWSFDPSSSTALISAATPIHNGLYTLFTEDVFGCQSPNAYLSITVNTPPAVPTIIASTPICSGQPLVMTSNMSCDSAVWNDVTYGGSLLGVNDSLIVPPVSIHYNPTIWRMECHDTATGCMSLSNSIFVNIAPAPSKPMINNPGPVCLGDSIVIGAPAVFGATSEWFLDSNLTVSLGVMDTLIGYNLLTDTTYYLVQTVGGCVSPRGSVTIQVNPLPPTPPAPANFSVCEGDTLKLRTAAGPSSFRWENLITGVGYNQQNVTIFPAMLSDSGLYSLHVIDANGCQSLDTFVYVTVNSKPTAPLAGVLEDTVCAGTDLLFGVDFVCSEMHWISPLGNTIITSNQFLPILSTDPNYVNGPWRMICVDTMTGCRAAAVIADTIVIKPLPSFPPVSTTSPVCNGDSVRLAAAVVFGANYTWVEADTTLIGLGRVITIPNITTDTAFYLIVGINGCTVSDTVFVRVQPPVSTPIPPNDTTVCIGESLLLSTPTVAASYLWTTPSSGVVNAPSIFYSSLDGSEAGIYTLSTIDSNGCQSADTTFRVFVNNPPPPPSPVTDNAPCFGDSLFLTVGGIGSQYLWEGPSGVAFIAGNIIGIGSLDTDYGTNWKVSSIDMFNCQSNPTTHNATIRTTPNQPIVSNNGPICFGDSVELTASFVAGATYTWTTMDSVTIVGTSSNTTFVHNITTDTAFLLTIDLAGCTNSDSTQVFVNPLPLTPLVPDSLIVCEDDTIFLLVTPIGPVVGYNWSGPSGFTSNQPNPFILSAKATNDGTYTVNVVDANGCQSNDTTLLVRVKARPAAPSISTPNTAFCDGDSLVLIKALGVCDSMVWINPLGGHISGTDTLAIVPPSTDYLSGNWHLMCVDTLFGCASDLSNVVTINIKSVPATPIIAHNGPACVGDSVTLSMSLVAGATYRWFRADSTQFAVGSVTSVAIYADTAFYGVVVVNGCSSSDSVQIQVLPVPNVPNIGAVQDSICEFDNIELTTTTAPAMYNWTGPNGFSSTLQNPIINNASLVNTGTYFLSVTDPNGCQSLDTSIIITVSPKPNTPLISGPSTICYGDTFRMEAANCGLLRFESPLGTFIDVYGSISLTIDSTYAEYVSGTWSVTCIDTATGCSSDVSPAFVINISPIPSNIAPFNNGPVCSGEDVQLSVVPQGPFTYTWALDSMFSLIVGTGTSIIYNNITTDTTFYVEVVNAAGCKAIDSTRVLVYPALATPNVYSDKASYCEGDSVVLSTDPIVGAYYWEDPAGFLISNQQVAIIRNVSTTNAGTYTLHVEDANGCFSTDTTINVIINSEPFPGLQILLGMSVCDGDSIILETNGPVCDSSSWIGPVQAQGGVGSQTVIYPIDPNYINGSWYLLCYDTITGCVSHSDTIAVVINPIPPTPVASNNGPICYDGSVDLSAAISLGANVYWYADTTLSSIGVNQNITVFNIISDSTFFVQQEVNGCLSPFASTTVTLHTTTAPNVPDSLEVCEGADIYLTTSSTGLAYSWSGPNGFVSTQQNPIITNVTVMEEGYYSLTMTDNNGCITPDTAIWVTVNITPSTPTIFQSTPTCFGDSLYLNISGSCTQSIWVGPTGNPIVSTDNYLAIAANHPDYQNGNWTMFCADTMTGCQAVSNTLPVTISPEPLAGIITNSGPVCFGDSVVINTTAIAGVAYYSWYNSSTNLVAIGQTVIINNITSDTLFYLVVDYPNGCVHLVDSVQILLNPTLPAPPIQVNSPVCEGATLQFTTTIAQGYNWSGPNGFSSTISNPMISPATVANSGLYTLNVYDANGCLSLDSTVNVVVNALPIAPVATGPITPICFGDTLYLTSIAILCDSAYWVAPNGKIVPGANPMIPSTDFVHYVAGAWQVYCLDTVTNCASASAAINVIINSGPTPVAVNNGPICPNGSATLSTAFTLGTSYSWYSDSNLSNLISTAFFVTVNNILSDSTFYLVTTSSVNSCSSMPTPTTVVVHPISAAPMIGADVQVCVGEDILLTTPAVASGYNWTGPAGFTASVANSTRANANILHAGFYYLNVVDSNGCTSLDTFLNVTVDLLPLSPTIPLLNSICTGDTLYLNADSTSNHCDSVFWVGPNGVNYAISGRNVIIAPSDTNYIGGLWELRCLDTISGCYSVSNPSLVLIFALPDTQATFSNSPVCIGGDVTLSTPVFGSFATYTWYADSSLTTVAATGQNPTIPNITTDTTFYLVISTGLGCNSLPMPTPVTVRPPSPAPAIPASFAVCEGEPFGMSTTTIATQYFWSSTNGFSSTSQNPVVTLAATIADSGLYTLSIIDSNGCVSSDTSLYVTVNLLGTAPTMNPVVPFCSGDTLFLTNNGSCGQTQWIGPNGTGGLGTLGGGNVLWTLGSTTAIASNNSNYLGGNWYSICIDTITGCQIASDTITVSILPNPVITTVTNSGPVCSGDSATLSVVAIGNSLAIDWYDDVTMLNAIGGGAMITGSSITTNTMYYVEVMNSAGCSDLDSTLVLINPIPAAPNVPVDMVLCEGEVIIPTTTTVASAYNWSGPNGFSSTVQYPAVITATVLDSGTYYLSIVDANGCTSFADSFHVMVNVTPIGASVNNSSPTCLGDSVSLTSSLVAGATYEWFKAPFGTSVGTGQNISLQNVTFADTGVYYVVVTIGGCSANSIDSTTVTVLGTSTGVAYAGVDQTICGSDSASMNAFGTAGSTGTWSTNSSATFGSINDPTTMVYNLPTGTSTFYWTLASTSCTSVVTDSMTINVSPLATDTAQAGLDQDLCGVTTTTLAGNATGSTGVWTQSLAQSSTGVAITNPSSPTSTITGMTPNNSYTFVWQFSNGACGVYSTDTVVINTRLIPSDNAYAGLNVLACGQDTVTLAAFNSSVGTGVWTTNSTVNIFDSTSNNTMVSNLLQDTTMFVWTLSNGLCTDYSSDTVLVIKGGLSPIANGDNFSVLAGQTTTINVLPNDNLTSSWDIYINTPTSNGQLINLNNGLFDVILQVMDTMSQTFIYELCNPACPNSCDTALVVLTVSPLGNCEIPNIFTPNGDGVNDVFEIPCLDNINDAWLLVFNRWGDLVYETDKYNNQWDGTHQGQPLPDATYFYIIKIGNGEQLQGMVEIRR